MKKEDHRKIEKVLKEFMGMEIEKIEFPAGEYLRIIEAIDTPVRKGVFTADEKKSWTPVHFSFPILVTAASCFMGAVIFLSFTAIPAIKIPQLWNTDHLITGGPKIESSEFLNMTESAGKFLRRFAESMNDNFSQSNL